MGFFGTLRSVVSGVGLAAEAFGHIVGKGSNGIKKSYSIGDTAYEVTRSFGELEWGLRNGEVYVYNNSRDLDEGIMFSKTTPFFAETGKNGDTTMITETVYKLLEPRKEWDATAMLKEYSVPNSVITMAPMSKVPQSSSIANDGAFEDALFVVSIGIAAMMIGATIRIANGVTIACRKRKSGFSIGIESSTIRMDYAAIKVNEDGNEQNVKIEIKKDNNYRKNTENDDPISEGEAIFEDMPVSSNVLDFVSIEIAMREDELNLFSNGCRIGSKRIG